MRQWRVGTISLGLILLGCGAALLSWLWSGQPVPVLYLRWWPLALIILALEILASTLPSRHQEPRFRYDGVSILLILIITIGSMLLSLADGFGLLERIAMELNGSTQFITLEPQQVTIPAGIRRIVVVTDNSDTQIIAADTTTCTIQGRLQGYGTEALWSEVVQQIKPLVRTTGDMLWLELPSAYRTYSAGQRVHQSWYEVIVPQNIPVEIECRGYTELDLRPHQVQQNWIVKGDRANVTITTTAADALRVQVSERDLSELDGNVPWLEKDQMITTLVGTDKATISIFSQGPVAVYQQ